MATCKDCIHYDRCSYPIDMIFKGTPAEKLTADRFNCFKDKSTFIEVPCKINDVVYGVKKYNGGWKVKKGIVNEMFFTKDMELVVVVFHMIRGRWGKTVFPTEAAAQQACQELEMEERGWCHEKS